MGQAKQRGSKQKRIEQASLLNELNIVDVEFMLNELNKMNVKTKIVSFGAYYKNDVREGVGVNFNQDNIPNFEQNIEMIFDHAKDLATASTDEIMTELNEFILKKDQDQPVLETINNALNIAAFILALTQRGAIVDDEYNGIILVYEKV